MPIFFCERLTPACISTANITVSIQWGWPGIGKAKGYNKIQQTEKDEYTQLKSTTQYCLYTVFTKYSTLLFILKHIHSFSRRQQLSLPITTAVASSHSSISPQHQPPTGPIHPHPISRILNGISSFFPSLPLFHLHQARKKTNI